MPKKYDNLTRRIEAEGNNIALNLHTQLCDLIDLINIKP